MRGFLLGAGASFELGLPLVDELTIEFKQAILRTFEMPYYKCSPAVERVLLSLLKDHALNYEDVVGRVEAEVRRAGNGPLHQEWHNVLERYLEAVYVLLLERHWRNKIYIGSRMNLLAPIARLCESEPLWIFSLNQDLVVEILAKHLNLPLKSGFQDRTQIKGRTFEILTRQNMQARQFEFLMKGSGLNLVKVHGSLDVFVQGDEKNYLKLANDREVFGVVDDLQALLKEDEVAKSGIKCTNQITYNDENGILQFLRQTIVSGKHKFSAFLSHAMDDWFLKIFQGHINYVDRLTCVGYGFRDLHVNQVLYDWLLFSQSRSLEIVDPYVASIPNDFRHLKDQISLTRQGFLSMLNLNANARTKRRIHISQTLRDFARKRFLKREKT